MLRKTLLNSVCLYRHSTVNYYKISVSYFHHLNKATSSLPKQCLRNLNRKNQLFRIIVKYESSAAYYRVPDTTSVDTGPNVAGNVSAETAAKELSSAATPAADVPAEQLATSTAELFETVPDIEAATEIALELNRLGEVTLSSLGLCRWTPVGTVQRMLEYIHVTFDLPWCGSIVAAVVVVRLMLFPVVIKSQRHNIKMANMMPRFNELQAEVTEARQSGNTYQAMKATQQLALYASNNEFKPAKSFVFTAIQGPVFLCFFLAIRSMCNLPVESMVTGGMYWFTDLTLADQYYLLPAFTTATLWATLQVGMAGTSMNINPQYASYVYYGLKLIPFGAFPFLIHFPSGLLVYWATNNLFSFMQVSFLKIPHVRNFFGIEVKKVSPPAKKTEKKKKLGIVKNIKYGYQNMRLAKEIDERDRLDKIAFQKAGRSPPIATYKQNPLKNKQVAEAEN